MSLFMTCPIYQMTSIDFFGMGPNSWYQSLFFLPKQVTEMGLSKFSHKTLAQLNSSNYATVYPPLNQFLALHFS